MAQSHFDILIAETKRKLRLEAELECEVIEMRKLLVRLGGRKLGAPDSDVEAALNAITNIERLQRMVERLFPPASWKEFLEMPWWKVSDC